MYIAPRSLPVNALATPLGLTERVDNDDIVADFLRARGALSSYFCECSKYMAWIILHNHPYYHIQSLNSINIEIK